MAKYRIEVEERRTITRETWIEAADADDAQAQAEALDWRTFRELGSDVHSEITNVEECDEQEQ